MERCCPDKSGSVRGAWVLFWWQQILNPYKWDHHIPESTLDVAWFCTISFLAPGSCNEKKSVQSPSLRPFPLWFPTRCWGFHTSNFATFWIILVACRALVRTSQYAYYISICNVFSFNHINIRDSHVLELEGLLRYIIYLHYWCMAFIQDSVWFWRGTEHINLDEVLVRVSYGLQKWRMHIQACACNPHSQRELRMFCGPLYLFFTLAKATCLMAGCMSK